MEAPLHIVYEDGDILLVNKSPDMTVHGVAGGPCTLANALAFHRPELPFHPVHRLDRGTSGLILLAKHAHAQEVLRRSLHTEDFCREYLALCEASPGSGRVERRLGWEGKKRIVDERGQSARTDYETLQTGADCALVRLRLHTGRTHQIRAHMAALGCPLLGDALYGGAPRLSRPALHSWRMHFVQPVTGESLCFTAELPPDMAALI
ncbi:MAG: RluA family pseudouridine synthase [Ruminococcaceae bacterium]|nr:RluA family pseudouridine synthase [Oscillospiraceae bacterium]